MAYSILKASITPVIDLIKSNGWNNNNNKDPKVLWDTINQAIPKISAEGWSSLIAEISNLNIKDYDSLRAHLSRFHFIKNKLAGLEITACDKVYQTWLLKGLKNWDANWVDMLTF